MIRVYLDKREVTGITLHLQLEKHISTAAARLQCVIAREDGGFLPQISAVCGDPLWVEYDNHTVFRGTVTATSGDRFCLQVTAYDKARALATNELLGIFQGSPRQIADTVCRRIGLQLGEAPNGSNSLITSQGGLTGLSVLRQAAGNDYFVSYENDRVSLLKKGAIRAALTAGTAILSLTHGQSIESIVNYALITNNKGQVVAEAMDHPNCNRYGEVRRYYQNTGGADSLSALAQSKLRGTETRCQMTLLGNFSVGCGMALPLSLPQLNLVGDFLIESVTHRVSEGIHTTILQLNRSDL